MLRRLGGACAAPLPTLNSAQRLAVAPFDHTQTVVLVAGGDVSAGVGGEISALGVHGGAFRVDPAMMAASR